MKVSGLPEFTKQVYLAYFSYAATGEGKTTEAQIVYDWDSEYANKKDDLYFKEQLKIGSDHFQCQYIPFVIEKDFMDQKYLDYNPEFKAKFYECFGVAAWEDFCLATFEDSIINMTYKMHFNLS